MTEQEILTQLAHCDSVQTLTLNEKKLLISKSKVKKVPTGECLIHQDAPASHLYILLTGKLQVESLHETIVLVAGEIIGEMAIFDDSAKHNANVEAIQDCQLLAIPYSLFNNGQ